MGDQTVPRRRRNALANIFADIGPSQMQQLHCIANDLAKQTSQSLDQDDDMPEETIDHPTIQLSFIDESLADLDNIGHHQFTTHNNEVGDDTGSDDTLMDPSEEVRRWQTISSSTRYKQRRHGVVAATFMKNLNTMNSLNSLKR